MELRALLMTMIVGVQALAMDYLVGDNLGWIPDVDYSLWVKGKHFRVGDSITFMYTPGNHNVVEVNATEFRKCTYSNATAKIFTGGNSIIPLTAPGKNWYICGMYNDCKHGMKLAITIFADENIAPAPAALLGLPPPPPTSSAAAASTPVFFAVMVLVAYGMIMAS